MFSGQEVVMQHVNARVNIAFEAKSSLSLQEDSYQSMARTLTQSRACKVL